MNLKTIFFLFSCMLLCMQHAFASEGDVNVWLSRLDSSLEHRSTYEKEYVRHINGMKALMNQSSSINTQFDVCRQLYLAYQSYRADSALVYAKKELAFAEKMKSDSRITLSKADIAYALFFTGESLDSYKYLEGLSSKGLPDNMKIEYYKDVSKICTEFGGILSKESREQFYKLRDCYIDSLIAITPSGSSYWFMMNAEKLQNKGKYKQAMEYYSKALKGTTLDKHNLAMLYSNVASLYEHFDDHEKSVIALIKSSIYDNESCTYEVTSLYNTAMQIKSFDSKRASNYLNQAVSMLLAYNGKFRFMNAGEMMSQIYQERINTVENRWKSLTLAIILILLVVIVTVVLLYIIHKKNIRLGRAMAKLNEKIKQLDNANNKLAESNNIKDTYIGQIFFENVEFIEKLGHVFNKIGRLLVVKKFDSIGELVSQKNLDKERKGMYRSFDKTFISLFPNFITSYNALFEEKDRKLPGKENILTNEMRIFALMRLGVKDSEHIARFLGFSVNTINTYKTRVKNRSIVPNDEFENRIMDIKS